MTEPTENQEHLLKALSDTFAQATANMGVKRRFVPMRLWRWFYWHKYFARPPHGR